MLLGGLYLSYGQHALAGEIFSRLLNETTQPAVRDRAWFYLGKVRYQRGLFDEAVDAFSRVGSDLPRFLRGEHAMLLSQSHMAQGRFTEAVAVLDGAADDSNDRIAYVRYNLGVALVRLNRIDEGTRLLDRVGQLDGDTPELRALRDKANLAIGYTHLQSGHEDQARAVLSRVRLHGPFSSKALLGVGWANAMQDDYRRALDPWLELQERDLLDSAVQESLLAVPYAFSRLGANGSAATHYRTALASFDRERIRLEAAINRATSGELIPALLREDQREIGRWHWQLETLPVSDDTRYLYHLVANNEFQDGLRSYRDLAALRDHLQQWQDKLGAFDDMVETRALAYEQRLPGVERRLGDVDIAELQLRRDELKQRLDLVEARRDVVGLADETQLELWRQLSVLEQNPAFSLDRSASARTKQRLLKGVLLWDLDRDYKYRAWRQRRSLAELDEALLLAGEFHGRTETAQAAVPEGVTENATRIAMLMPRIEVMQDRITASLGQQEKQLQVLAARELEAQKKRLDTYRVQARFALATIYDRAGIAANAGQGDAQ